MTWKLYYAGEAKLKTEETSRASRSEGRCSEQLPRGDRAHDTFTESSLSELRTSESPVVS